MATVSLANRYIVLSWGKSISQLDIKPFESFVHQRVARACAQPELSQSMEAVESEASKENSESCGFQYYGQSRSRSNIYLFTA
jgi:hypothetical protein